MDNTPPEAITFYGGIGRTKTAVRVATTAALTLSAMQAGTTLDGVTLAASDRVLVKNQPSGAENGLYTIRTSLAPLRATDADAAGELRFGDLVPVTAGTVGAGTYWRLTTANTITIGTTLLTFVQDVQSSSVSGSTMDNTAPGARSYGTTFDNTAPGVATLSGNTMTNVVPGAATLSGNTMSNVAPGAATLSGNTMSNTVPGQVVLAGEQSPVAGITPPTPPNVVNYTETLVAGTHYTVQVVTRSAPVTISLPDPGSLGQRIEVVDTSGQNSTYNTTVSGGTKQIENTGTTKVLSGNYQVLAIYYDGTKWKII